MQEKSRASLSADHNLIAMAFDAFLHSSEKRLRQGRGLLAWQPLQDFQFGRDREKDECTRGIKIEVPLRSRRRSPFCLQGHPRILLCWRLLQNIPFLRGSIHPPKRAVERHQQQLPLKNIDNYARRIYHQKQQEFHNTSQNPLPCQQVSC